MLGPGLGGGHGRYQGFYGMISDNIVKLNVVLADGSAITVSENSHSDLLWAMKGAGHNFGIVTSFELKIYPRLVDTWYYRNYVWKQDKLETLFGELNKLHSNTSHIRELAVNYGTYGVNESISSTEVSYPNPSFSWNQVFDCFRRLSGGHLHMLGRRRMLKSTSRLSIEFQQNSLKTEMCLIAGSPMQQVPDWISHYVPRDMNMFTPPTTSTYGISLPCERSTICFKVKLPSSLH